ncbi:ABC transporter ATP-binding protein [Gluconacetobacter tumulisoli]|uniref:ABC transporter ATP-binding protein n=1 Tax=Gluconacetobacter tumulisoli TaxID=1286189 RepID=A0A7W4KA03_9PROT|nr:oligopeptide/dipeptide ABC transporter ATP-binding protein [Gluconacetobacter tumulisoli]MBB2203045.1 ABC transporter ATP-binding protein [Gluconacetobacter tumulisoli]
MSALLRYDRVTKAYARPSLMPWGRPRSTPILHGISFALARGETLGIVGESGSGKSTLGRLALRLSTPTGGRILYDGQDINALTPAGLRAYRTKMQMIFQDPHNSLDPSLTVGMSIAEALDIHRSELGATERSERVGALLSQVGLSPTCATRRPHEFSGGQKQRIGIARALAVEPELIVADEAVSALDVSVQAHILNLMRDLRDALGLSYLFIAHDLAVVRRMSHRVAVLYRGRIVEMADRDDLFTRAQHPYTRMLLAAAPRRGTHHAPATEMPLAAPGPGGQGCPFHARCTLRQPHCAEVDPPSRTIAPGHEVACHLV